MVLLTGFGLGCIAIQILLLMRDVWNSVLTRVYTGLLISAGILLLMPYIEPSWRWLAWDVSTATPAVFWLLCQLAFSNSPNLRTPWSVIALYSFIAPALGRAIGVDAQTGSHLNTLLWAWPRLCEYALVLHGVWHILATWSGDLINARRRLRVWLLCVLGTGILGVTVGLNTGLASDLFLHAVVCTCTLVSAVFMLNGRVSLLAIEESKSNLLEQESSSLQEAAIELPDLPLGQGKFDALGYRLQSLMSEGFYRTEGLTLKILSRELNAPLHKTRALINHELGFRNFSDYLNQLRIAEATERLRNEPETPVLNIALDVGYRNISSFNRVFKEQLKLTPTMYRQSEFPVFELKNQEA